MTLCLMPIRALFSLSGLSVQVLVPQVRHGENDTEEKGLSSLHNRGSQVLII